MPNSKLKNAFSLIELSIVLLIIGILIAGVTQSSLLIAKFKLEVGRSNTKNSPVNGTQNLVAWFETTLEESFDSNVGNGSAIANWYDVNQTSTYKNNATQTTSGNQPTYAGEILNGLPVVRFSSGSQQFFNLPDGTVPFNNSPYTIFFVSSQNSLSSGGLLGSGDYGSTNNTNAFRYNLESVVNYWWGVDILSSNMLQANKFYIIDFSYDLSSRKIYIDGSLSGSLSSSNNQSTSASNTIGLTAPGIGEYLDGNIAEIIIFDRALSNDERQDIERYLSKKWGITLS
jgi:prepilin-type N-terminal cleavage/methylation domain-containing protein